MDEGPLETEYQTRSYECVLFCSFTLCDNLILRAHAEPTVTSADIPLVTLEIARAMNPRPPSPAAAAATQRKHRRENLKLLNTCGEVTTKMQSIFSSHCQKDKTSGLSRAGPTSSGLMAEAVLPLSPSAESKAPVRPPRDARRKGPQREQHQFAEQGLIKWANGHLPGTPVNHRISNYNELDFLRIAESIKDIRGSCAAPKSMFPQGPDQEMLEGLFALVDFLLGEDANSSSGTVNIDDALQSKREKAFQLLRALRAWERHRAVLQPIGMNAPQAGPSQVIARG
jgi:hypothetical protein